MRYGWTLAGDAIRDSQLLEPWLQEEVLDEVEGIAGDPSILPPCFPGDPVVYRFSRKGSGAMHYLTLTIWRNDTAQHLTVLGITRRVVLARP